MFIFWINGPLFTTFEIPSSVKMLYINDSLKLYMVLPRMI